MLGNTLCNVLRHSIATQILIIITHRSRTIIINGRPMHNRHSRKRRTLLVRNGVQLRHLLHRYSHVYISSSSIIISITIAAAHVFPLWVKSCDRDPICQCQSFISFFLLRNGGNNWYRWQILLFDVYHRIMKCMEIVKRPIVITISIRISFFWYRHYKCNGNIWIVQRSCCSSFVLVMVGKRSNKIIIAGIILHSGHAFRLDAHRLGQDILCLLGTAIARYIDHSYLHRRSKSVIVIIINIVVVVIVIGIHGSCSPGT
mmetsp:Transcript_12001/g.18082  ORF Transcript_12001/g.18082 Transcript_12001/m.18082 type:complete len:258 (-) Transcript_12001:406-1179(-)